MAQSLSTANQIQKISFYIVAHADDWQLFMQPRVFNDLTEPGTKTVIIITTAGDAGMKENFWRAREIATTCSVRYCLTVFFNLSECQGWRLFEKHPVWYTSINQATLYFLRLPDGGINGGGFEANYYQSLEKFRMGKIMPLGATDHSTQYATWQELVNTIASIIHFETGQAPIAELHYPDYFDKRNPGDHPDHYATGYLAKSVITTHPVSRFLYSGYSIQLTDHDLSQEQVFWKIGMFAAYEKALVDACGYSTIKEAPELYSRWCSQGAKFYKAELA